MPGRLCFIEFEVADIRAAIAVFAMLLSGGSATLWAGDFSQFRGTEVGNAGQQSIPIRWSDSENLGWKVPMIGTGWSQPVVWKDRIYITAAVSSEDLKPKNFSDGVKMPQSMGLGGFTKPPSSTIDWQVQCFEAATGQMVWAKSVTSGKAQFPVHPSNTYATETPVVNENGIVAFFGATGVVAGLDHSGQSLWQQELGAFATDNGFGTGSSMAQFRNQVFVQHFTKGSSVVVSFDSATGKELWRFERDTKGSSWSSPIVWRNALRPELIISGGDQVDSLDPETGSPLWQLSKVKAPTACSMAADAQRIYFGGSDPFSKGPLFAVRPGASGAIAPQKKNGNFEHCDWLTNKAAPGMASPVSDGQFVYVVEDNILRCYDAANGERAYQTRIPNLGKVAASPLLVGQQLLILDESGRAALVKTGKEFEVVGEGNLNDTFWSTPAVSNGALFLRGVQNLYCIRGQ